MNRLKMPREIPVGDMLRIAEASARDAHTHGSLASFELAQADNAPDIVTAEQMGQAHAQARAQGLDPSQVQILSPRQQHIMQAKQHSEARNECLSRFLIAADAIKRCVTAGPKVQQEGLNGHA